MSDKIMAPFLTLPVELVYRIFDQMNDWTILCFMQNVCTRIDTILDTYHRYQVNYFFNLMFHFQRIIHSHNLYFISAVYFFSLS
jgi:hypothetical protein